MPAIEIIRKPWLPDLVGFRVPEEYGPLIDGYVQRIKWTGVLAMVDMYKPRRPRTTGDKSQNHHLNGHIQGICVETGNSFEAVKMAVKLRAVEMGYPFQTLPNGAIDPQSEAASSTEECAILIESAHMIAAEWGIALIESDD
jgi:hypothetical protein